MALGFVEPMMPTLVDEPPEGDGWQHEIKYDGYRTELVIAPGEAHAFTRRGHDWTDRYRPIVEAARSLPCESAILDGEIVMQDEQGRSDYHALRAEIHRSPHRLVFMAFDLLHLYGEDLRNKPLTERRSALEQLLGDNRPESPLQFSAHLATSGAEFLAAVDAMGLEGIVSKKANSRYRSGTTKNWLKTKTFVEEEFVVIGTSKGDRAPVALLAREDAGGLSYAGGAMMTLPQPDRDRFWEAIDRIRTSTPPIPMDPRKETGWAKPLIRVRAKTLRREEMLRHATVTQLLELPGPAAPQPPKKRSSEEPPLPNPKLDRAEVQNYYEAMAPVLLPWISGRPLNMLRCSGSKCWFQRNLDHPPTEPGTFGPAVRRIPIFQKNGKTEDYLFIDSEEGLSQAVAAGVVEFHGWGSGVADVERPNRLVIDLDPDEELGFEHVREAAFEVRRAFDFLKLKSFPLLSGGKGIHVIVPIEPEAEWQDVRGFAYQVCSTLAEARPDRFTVALPKAERRGRIFLDYLRNQRTATAILPYSVRARPEAPVAAPVTWQELKRVKSASKFAIREVNRLLSRARSKRLTGWAEAKQTLPL